LCFNKLIREIIFFCLISPHLYVEDIQFFSEVLFDELQIAGTHSFRNQSVNTLKKKVKNYGAKDPTQFLIYTTKSLTNRLNLLPFFLNKAPGKKLFCVNV
jgi:hypothetical protein